MSESKSNAHQGRRRAGLTARQFAALAVVVAATAFIGIRFVQSAQQTTAATRLNACRSLAPAALPDAVSDGIPKAFTLADANGKNWSLSTLQGRPVLLNFWATWCAPCVEEMPSLEALQRKLGDKALVLAVSVDESWAPVKRFFSGGTGLSILLDTSKTVPESFGTKLYPETFLIGADGTIRHFFQNKRKWDSSEAVECILGAV